MRESINRTLPLGVTTLSDSITTCLLPGRLLPEAVTVKDADRTTGGKDMADVAGQPDENGRRSSTRPVGSPRLGDDDMDEGIEQDALSSEQMLSIHQRIDTDQDGKISWHEFMTFFRGK